jgi:hypothetical protein
MGNSLRHAPSRLRTVVLCLAVAAATGCDDLLTPAFDYGEIEVVAARRSGDGVPGVRLTLYTGTRHLGYGITEADGRFVFDFVPQGQIAVLADPPEGYRPVNLASGFIEAAVLPEGAEATFNFTYLKEGTGSVAVRVVEDSGKPIAGLRLQLNTGEGAVAQAVTGPTGEFVFDNLPLNHYSVFAFPMGALSFPDGSPLGIVDDLLIDEGHRELVEFTLSRCTGDLRVRVIDTGGAPISGLLLRLYTWEGTVGQGRTNDDGVYERLIMDCGNYGLDVERRPGIVPAGTAGWTQDGILVEEGELRSVQMVFARCEARFGAQVFDESGAPVAAARIVLYTSAGFVDDGLTDSGGRADFSAVPCHDEYGVAVEPPDGYSVREGRGQSYFDGISLREGDTHFVTFTVRRI